MSKMSPVPTREISLFDGLCLIVGIMVGAGIFESAPAVAQNTTGPWILMGVWVLGGLLSFLGALCYAGLARKFPETGGDYVFLKEAYGPRMSFLYAWCMLTVVRPGALGAMAYVFGRYAQQVFPLPGDGIFLYACGSIVFLSILNLLGTRLGKDIQDFLTVVKVLGIAFLVFVALGMQSSPPVVPAETRQPSFTLALIFVLFAYGGWNEIAFVAAEVKDPQKNLLRTLTLGTLIVSAIYLFLNLTFLHAVGFTGLQESGAVAHSIATGSLPRIGSVLVNSLIAISALGAVHGMIFSGARIYYAMGRDHRFFSHLGRWDRRGTPLNSILAESLITLGIMMAFTRGIGGFQSLVLYTTPLFWGFTALVAVSSFWVLGRADARKTVPGFPITPALFFLTCLFMLCMSLQYAFENLSSEIFWSLGLVAVGLVVQRFEEGRSPSRRHG